ncbi:MAG TPA: 23S rRNA (pseudouridine(1915)-N(3))-methyltransferase RlmH [Campylobacterales bacterium]|nr:23S rRNA (pseudouridine(1915)-N(3))-methyltransferase RlmH [Campylobacterales bacterium]
MQKIEIYLISKKDEPCYDTIANEFIKMSQKYATIKIYTVFNKMINQSQKRGEEEAKSSYSKALETFLKKDSLNIALDPLGKELDSFEFANMIKDSPKINFFIGGAFGFGRSFIKKCEKNISLSKLTLNHKIAKLVLLEQLYRAFTIINLHPYHK